MKIQKILALAVLSLLVVLAAQLWRQYQNRPGQVMFAAWHNKPESLKDAQDLAEEVVVGKVVKIERADDLVAKAPKAEGNMYVPVEVVTIEIERKLKGEKKGEKETIQLFHTGLSGQNPLRLNRKPPKGKVPEKPGKDDENYTEIIPRSKKPSVPSGHGAQPIMLHGDPAYKVGERYTLFITKGPTLKVKGRTVSTKAVISPEGRYRMKKGSNTLEPVTSLGFAGRLKNKNLSAIEAAISKKVQQR